MIFGLFFGSSLDFEDKSSIFREDVFFFWSSLDFGDKNSSICDKDLFVFGLHSICLHEKNSSQALSLPVLKTGQNWGKIANYPPMLSIIQQLCVCLYVYCKSIIPLRQKTFFCNPLTQTILKGGNQNGKRQKLC